MRHVLDTEVGRGLYRQRRETVEPLFGHTKQNRKFTRFHRRGRLGVRTEWRLLMTTPNLTKRHRYHSPPATPRRQTPTATRVACSPRPAARADTILNAKSVVRQPLAAPAASPRCRFGWSSA
jgi:Transposase DDE domain